MRLRNIPRADGVIDAHRAVIKKPEEQRGQWAQVFGNEKFRLKSEWERASLF